MKRAIAILASALSLAVMAGTPAQAAPSQGSDSTATATKSGSARSAVAAASVITCRLQINNPHKSGHVPGMVNITATWTCTAPVTNLTMNIYLYRNDLFQTRGTAGNSGKSYLQGNTATPCVTGTYQGIALGQVTFPPGYTPGTQSGNVYSPKVYISCP